MIIRSRLDNDWYQFTMSQFAWLNYPAVQVRYEFRNRTFAVPLAECLNLSELREEIEDLRMLRFKDDEIQFLRSQGCFTEGYLDYLANDHELPEVEIRDDNGHLVLEYEGRWVDSIFLETPVLALVTELYFERFQASRAEGSRRLAAKIKYLKETPSIRFMEFGTRRRYSARWQETVISRLRLDGVTNLLGTSNVALAMAHNMQPMGTMAHQLFMVTTALALAENPGLHLQETQRRVAGEWLNRYPQFNTVLPDTFTTRCLLPELELRKWKVRQDSGDPFEIGEYIVSQYFDPKEQCELVFSDGLDLRTMNMLVDRFAGRVKSLLFGWGTNLTNDMGLEGLSLVIKPKTADGHPCVKLSDNPAKATGTPEAIAFYKEKIKSV